MSDRLSEIKARPAVIRTVLDVEWLIAEVGRLKGDVEYGAGEWHEEGIATGMERAAVIADKEQPCCPAYVSIAAAIRAEASK